MHWYYVKRRQNVTNTEKTPNITTGFLPIRSAAMPQIVEVKHLPNIKAAPINIQ
jgi:hypothetical protein